MGSLSGSCEIVEVKGEQMSFDHFKGNHQPRSIKAGRKPPGLETECRNSMEDDINKLFESISVRNSPKTIGLSERGIGSPRKNSLKKPMRAAMSPPGIGFSEPVSLKQAFRGLCITQASEMAAMKRSSKLTASPRISEAGKITSLYRSVVIESENGLPISEGRKGRVEISLVPEDSSPASSERISCNLEEPTLRSLIPCAQSSLCSEEPNAKIMESISVKNDMIPALILDKNQPSKTGPADEETVTLPPSLPFHKTSEYLSNSNKSLPPSVGLSDIQPKNSSSDSKLPSKTAPKLRRKAKLQNLPSSSNAVSKARRNVPRAAKSVIRSRNFPKKKIKQDSVAVTGAFSTSNDKRSALDPNSGHLICQRCQCAMKDAGASKLGSALNGCGSGSTAVKNNLYLRQRDKGEYSQSSKSSIGEYSSSTSLSDESNISGSSCGNRPHMSKDIRWEAINHVRKQHGFLGLRNFNLLKKLGCGDIGTVYLAELIGKKCLFAIKVMDNEYLARRKKMPRAQTEREILRMLDHPFLPTLYAHFVSDNLSCFVMEYCPGGDLHVLRQRQPGRYYPEHAARFYVAEVLLALEYLHMLGIVYRDLKPENILVREDGHIMLTDFDLSLQCSVEPTLLKSSSLSMEPARISGPCKGSGCIDPFCAEPTCQVSCFSPRFFPTAGKSSKLKANAAIQARSLPQLVAEPTDARSNSFVGTHEYLAPEITKGEGHGSAVDWWTLGIFLYELLYGKTPFKGSGNDETLANVVLQSLRFPESPIVSFQARDLIRGLLEKEPENRLGYHKGAAEIKQHPFFNGLNWALIRCAIPPQIPEFCDIVIPKTPSTGEHLEFELF